MAERFRSPTFEARRAQMFPVLTEGDIARMRHFGTLEHHADGERLIETGKPSPGMFVVLSGAIRLTRREGLGHEVLLVEVGAGGFSAEIGQLSGKPAFVDGHAHGELETLLIAPGQLRALLIAEAAL